MTDEGRSLSRRERRAQEQRDAAAAEPTDALSEIPTTTIDGRLLTRKERRRLERTVVPIETWTAEEEARATGQIPAMTPERIAEQEAIARAEREKAEQAQLEAEAAAADVPVADGDQRDDAAVEPAAESAPEPAPEPAPALPRRTSVIPAAEPVAHAEPQPEPEREPEREPEPEPAPAQQAEPAVHAEPDPQPGPAADPEPEPASEPQPEPEPVAEPESESEPEPDPTAGSQPEPVEELQEPSTDTHPGMPAGMSPEMFEVLFPPGSLQRKLMEQQAQEDGDEPWATAPAETSETAEPDAADEPQPDPTTATPASGVDGDVATQAARPSFDELVAVDADVEPLTEGPVPDETAPMPPFAAVRASSDDTARANEAFEQAALAHGAFHSRQEAAAQTPPASSMWDRHPLESVEAASTEVPEYEPSGQIPKPDLSQLSRTSTFSPTQVPPVEPVPTGQVEVARREALDAAEDEERHRSFRWAHLAVLGAVAFVLGVVVYNVWRG